MEMNVRDDQKLVEIWLTNAEKIDPVLQEGLKEIYAKYKTKKYMVAVFESGKGDLYENTRDLLLFNRVVSRVMRKFDLALAEIYFRGRVHAPWLPSSGQGAKGQGRRYAARLALDAL